MRGVLVFLLALVFGSSVLKAEAVKIGWLPYTNALSILDIHKPLREYLEKSLGVSVEILTSSGYEEFHFSTTKSEYDVVVTGPHFGALAIKEGFVPLLKYKAVLKPLFVVQKGSSIKSPNDLKGKNIALSNYLSVSSMGGVVWLIDSGLQKDKDFTLLHAKSHPSAIHSVIIGEASAAITTMTPIKQLAPELLEKIDYFEAPFAMPHLFTIAKPSLDKEMVKKIKEALVSFQSTEAGKLYFEKTGYKGYVDINSDDLKAMEPFLPLTKSALEEYGKGSK